MTLSVQDRVTGILQPLIDHQVDTKLKLVAKWTAEPMCKCRGRFPNYIPRCPFDLCRKVPLKASHFCTCFISFHMRELVDHLSVKPIRFLIPSLVLFCSFLPSLFPSCVWFPAVLLHAYSLWLDLEQQTELKMIWPPLEKDKNKPMTMQTVKPSATTATTTTSATSSQASSSKPGQPATQGQANAKKKFNK